MNGRNEKLKKVLVIGILILMIVGLVGCTEKVTETPCDHDWVITSKWDWWRNSYKTVSKCSKCGKVI